MEFCEQCHFYFYFVLIIHLRSLFSPPAVKALGHATVILVHLDSAIASSQSQVSSLAPQCNLHAEGGVLALKHTPHG